MNQQLLRRAWDALDAFKQAYPENWHDEDEQVMNDLMRTDMKMSGVQTKWVGLTDEEIKQGESKEELGHGFIQGALWAEAKLKEKNT